MHDYGHSVLAAFYYGNLTYPTHDPPKMGFLSTVPSDASDRMEAAVAAAGKVNNNFPGSLFDRLPR